MKSKAKKPKQDRSKKLVSAVLEATTRVLKSKPLEAVNTNQIAEVAGVSIGSLYQYFQNKESLVAVLIENRLAAQLDQLNRHLDRSKGLPVDQVIDRFVRSIAEDSLRNRPLLRTFYKQAAKFDSSKVLEENRKKVSKLVKDFLIQEYPDRFLKMDSSTLETRIFVFINSVVGTVIASVMMNPIDEENDQRTISELVRMGEFLID